MKIWTYAEARQKLQEDLDLQDQIFVQSNELIGYFNEGIEEAETDILKIDEDYFLTSQPIPLVAGVSAYPYPYNMVAFKERGIIYANGSIIYDVKRFRRRNKFENLAFANQYAFGDDYRWFHTHDTAGAAKINIIPPSRETAIVPPTAGPFTPMVIWYIRHADRVPRLGEYIPQYEQVLPVAVDIALETITVGQTYVTGDQVKLGSTVSVPGGLTAGTIYFVISGSNTIKLATTLQNAMAGTAINLTTQGVGVITLSIAANQSIIDNTLIDIPEFTKFVIQWAKVCCLNKDGDPRYNAEMAKLSQQREQMNSTLSEIQQDDENTIEPDFSAYTEMA